MRDSIEDHIAIFDRENRPPLALAQPVGSSVPAQRSNIGMPLIRRRGNQLQPLQEAPGIGPRQPRKLLHDGRRDNQRQWVYAR